MNMLTTDSYFGLQVAFAASSIELNDRERFQSLFRTLPTFINLVPALVVIMKQFGWMQMAVITQQESLFTSVMPHITT